MADSWSFWKSWPRDLRSLFLFVAAMAALTMLTVLGFEIAGHHLVLDWYLTTETETVRIPLDRVSVGLFELEIPAEVYLMKQHFEGSPWMIRPWAGGIYLSIIAVFCSALLAVSTYLPRFWYIVSTTIFIGLLVSLRLEQLLIFGWFDYKPLAVAILFFLPLSYYFHAFKSFIPLVKRVVAFAASFGLLALVIFFGAQIDNPFYTLAQYSFTAPVTITVAFVVLVGHEVVYFILRMITSGKAQTGSRNWVHFFTFSIIYLVNVGLVYANNAGYIKWDILYLNEFLMLAISASLGLWGLKARENRYENIAPFFPLASLFYVAFGGIAFTTIGYQMIQGNDPALEAFEDAIIYSQLAFGVIFLLYIIVNFITPLMKNMSVYRIVFKEGTLPYPTYRLAGFIAVVALFLLSNRVALNQSIAGYYNSLGDLYKVRNEQLLSEQYYLQGALYGYQNHKSNYQLGFIANSKEKPGQALYRFELATGKNPSAQAFVNLSNQYQSTDQFFKGIFALQKGEGKFPANGYIGNNLGVLYSATNILDSASFYLQQGLGKGFSERAATTNLGYVAFKSGVEITTDEIMEASQQAQPYGFLTNALATLVKAQRKQLPDGLEALLPDSTLTGFTFPFVYNAALVDVGHVSGKMTEMLPVFMNASTNGSVYGNMSIANALHDYYSGEAAKAIQILNRVQQAYPSQRAYCFHLMGAISLDMGAQLKAAEYFESASAGNFADADFNQTIALSEAGSWEQASLAWIFRTQNDRTKEVAESVLSLTEVTSIEELLTDQDRYQYARWFAQKLTQDQQTKLLDSFDNENMKKGAMVCLARAAFEAKDIISAKKLLGNASLEDWDQLERWLLQLAIDLQEKGLNSLVDNPILNKLPPKYGQVYVKLANGLKTNNVSAVKEAFLSNPFDGVLAAATADYLSEVDTKDAAYEALVAAIGVNPYNADVLKKYIWLALDMGFTNYAENSLVQLIDLLPPSEYKTFEREYDARVDELERERDSWNFD